MNLAAVYVPLWVPVLAFCLLCLTHDLPHRIRAWRRHKQLLNHLWDDNKTGAGGLLLVGDDSGRTATTTPAPAPQPYDRDTAA